MILFYKFNSKIILNNHRQLWCSVQRNYEFTITDEN